jgi:predicted DCC family thiol-disulfide oxidoreductase YuxK
MAKEQPEFLMYGVPDCPFCEEAMQLMLEHCRENNIRFTAHIQDWDNYTIPRRLHRIQKLLDRTKRI